MMFTFVIWAVGLFILFWIAVFIYGSLRRLWEARWFRWSACAVFAFCILHALWDLAH
jgi:hypothetical protein